MEGANLRLHRHQVYLALGIAGLSPYMFLGTTARAVVYGLAGFSAVLLIVHAAVRASGWRRWMWWLFAAGLGLSVVADTLSSWYEIDSGTMPFPSPADAFYFVSYWAIAGGLAVVALRKRALWRTQMLDSAMVAAATAYCGWLFLISPSSGGFDLASLSAVSYPVMDVIVLSLLVWLVLGRSCLDGSARWLLASLVLWLATDVVYAHVLITSEYANGALDFGWMVSYLCWGAAALHPAFGRVLADRPQGERGHTLQVLAPAIAFTVVPVSLLVQTVTKGEAAPFEIAIGGLVLGALATARVVHLVRSEHVFREKAEQSERHFRSLIENSTDVFTVMDAETRTMYTSPSSVRLLGYEPNEIAGTAVLDMIHPDDLAKAEEGLAAVLEGEDAFAQLRLRHKDGSWVPVEAVGTNRLDDPAVRGIVVCTRDVREREAAAAERHRLEQELHHSQKMDAIGRLAGGVAHDFNNLLMVIAASTESILLDLPPDQETIRGKLGQTQTAVDRAATLTQQLLTFSRRQQPALRVLDLNEQVESTCGMLRRIIGEDVLIELDLDPSAPRVHADSGQIDQVLFNLAVNARDAMFDGGRLSFATRRDGDSVLLEVRDTGAGMDEETQDRLFEPFFTTKPPGDGTGLGLATVYGIVTRMGGTVRVDSAVGVGTVFTIVLPNADENLALQTTETKTKPAAGGETILLVEDEEIVRAVVREGLEQYGYRVFDTGDPREAPGLARLHRADLLVTDVRMPHMDGFQLFDELRAIRPDLKTVFMSGYSETSYASVAHDGSTAFLQKPFGIGDMARRVRGLLDAPDVTASAA